MKLVSPPRTDDTLDLVTIGEAMAMFVAREYGDLAEVEHFIKRIAGAELNVATGIARLGLRAGWVSRVGNDAFGRYVLNCLEKEGIDHRQVTVDSGYATGFQIKSLEKNGIDPIVQYFRKNSAASHLSVADFSADYFLRARHLHLTGVAAALSPEVLALCHHAADAALAAGRTLSFDPNLRPVLWPDTPTMVETLNALAFKADLVLPGLQEGKLLTGHDAPQAIADFYLEQGVKAVVIKLGPQGAWFKSASGEQATIPGFPVAHVVDTVGAGDGFAVGVLSALLEGKAPGDALRRGNLIGSLAVQVQGDSEGLPNREQLAAHEQEEIS
ncbi:sugar kinase [Entomohabitans teleogrylli]|uniref:sugar kinase n=1 Tax=Entomohabitans teleogrylli TaxID=1384589 RepID=UPI00073D4499|nr:sugar kinase [Entomohabitans teleogrylli]